MMTKVRILPLARTPVGHTEIIDWPPFDGGDSLGEIVSKHNEECKKTADRLGWPSEYIDQILDHIDIVRYDLDALGKLSSDDFETIEIIFADLDVAYSKPTFLGYVRAFIGKKPKKYYLLQVGKKPNPVSLTSYLAGFPVFPVPVAPPQLLTTQKQFEDFLDRYCVPLSFDSLHSPGDDPHLPPPGPGGSGPGGAINPKDLADAVSKVKADVRNAAIERNLSHEETSSLMRLAVEQELVLKNIELAIRQQTFGQLEHGPIVLNSLRKPIREIATQPFQHPHFKKVELIQVRPERPLWDISGQERRILHRLGVKNQTYTVVHENTFYTQKLLDRLGGSVKVSKLSADLPDFKI